MATQLSIAEARNKLTQLPEELARSPETGAVVVTRHGKPVLAVMSWELYESVIETLDILSEPDLMAALRQSIQEAEKGMVLEWEVVKKERNL